MEKNSFIKARISSATKLDFESICQELGVQPTTKARELIEAFVQAEYGRLSDRITVHIYRPSGYDFGAWRVKMRLRNPAELEWEGAPVPFAFPELPSSRRLHPDDGFLAIVRNVKTGEHSIGGQFVKGRWEGHLYSNGVAEGENQTSIEQVQVALRETINNLLTRFGKASLATDPPSTPIAS
ncbi:hypothetical protein FJV80_17390 [Mesorhizobium sp. WSM4310]|uniref:hypothetical protein n=1 Tax=Mesorhizobium sp. WSM4310 TaxID=2589883 RepID=UPI00115F075D|nr:hypothetical protein [Mesorhizobium sp. WSM4310]TRC84425.1 hypothetical protein FJV80_17390 [Mesorhizobium sp. WSM4310]